MSEDTLAACELCYTGATDEEMERCAVTVDPEGLEGELLATLEAEGVRGRTIVAYALNVEREPGDAKLRGEQSSE